MHITHTTLSAVSLAAIASLGLSNHAQAITFTGNSSGTWEEPNPENNADPQFSGVGTNTFNWGDDTAFETGSSELSFEGDSFSTESDNTFSLGNLTYFNGTALPNTEVGSVPLSVELGLTAPNGSTEAFSFDFDVVSTTNMGTPEGNADSVSLLSTVDDSSFNVDGTEYTLELTGFSQDSNTAVDQLRTLEGETTTGQVLGQITEGSSSVPEPEQIPELVSEPQSVPESVSEPEQISEPVSEPQPVPEPTTTVGMGIALGLGAFLKRKQGKAKSLR